MEKPLDDLVLIPSSSIWGGSNKRKRNKASPEHDTELDGFDDNFIPSTVIREYKRVARIPCSICLQDTTKKMLIAMNCACCSQVCRKCLNNWVNTNGDLPECCGIKVRYGDYEEYLTKANKKRMKLRGEELADRNPMYCAATICGAYIQKPRADTQRSEFIICSYCRVKTCMSCKRMKKEHVGTNLICPDSSKDMEEVANMFGWKTCPRCHAVIEKSKGCNHIRCRCGCEFAYCCGKIIKSCDCSMA